MSQQLQQLLTPTTSISHPLLLISHLLMIIIKAGTTDVINRFLQLLIIKSFLSGLGGTDHHPSLFSSCISGSASTRWFVQAGIPYPRDNRIVRLHQSPDTLLSLSSSSSSKAISTGSNQLRATETKVAAVRHLVGSVTTAHGLRFAVVVARFNVIITKPLLEGALTTFHNYAVQQDDIDVVWVPGSFEIGVVAQKLASSGKYDAVLCIGAVIRGDTTHYDAVANSAASGVLSAGLKSGVPCIFGVLTCDNMEQALNRAGGKSGNKVAETALTAIEMASLFVHQLK